MLSSGNTAFRWRRSQGITRWLTICSLIGCQHTVVAVLLQIGFAPHFVVAHKSWKTCVPLPLILTYTETLTLTLTLHRPAWS